MRTILILGAGRSSASLIQYLLGHASEYQWKVVIGDISEASARERLGQSEAGSFIHFDINNEENSAATIRNADVVISLLPALMHPKVARHCLAERKHLLTASYVASEMQVLHDDARNQGLLFLNECGLDPGIDHMSAMQIIDRIKATGGTLSSFESFTGGLIAPETDRDNPWRYKFTWNPRNVVMAGQGTAKYLEKGRMKYVPYQQLFTRATKVSVPGYGNYEGYANRDSLQYIQTYGLDNIKTMVRGTLRNEGYCAAWNILVQLGCCDDSFKVDGVSSMTHLDYIKCFTPHSNSSVQHTISELFSVSIDGPEMRKLSWSGLFEEEMIGLQEGSPAQILEHILNKKWQLKPEDRDLVVMWHRFNFSLQGEEKQIQASLVAIGETSTFTAMAKTVGLPLAIAAKLLLAGKIHSRGVVLPISPEFYNPILGELKMSGVQLHESEVSL